jgi:hypothetical protein
MPSGTEQQSRVLPAMGIVDDQPCSGLSDLPEWTVWLLPVRSWPIPDIHKAAHVLGCKPAVSRGGALTLSRHLGG